MSSKTNNIEDIKNGIFNKITEYYHMKDIGEFIPGKSKIYYAYAIFNEKEAISMVDTILKGWFGLGVKDREFTKRFSDYIGVYKTVLANSGSSANLLATAALTSKKLEKPLQKGDEVITPASTFPTTLNPILQCNLKPVLVDVDIETLNVNIELVKEAISSKTRAIMVPHTLGIPNDMDALMNIVDDHELFLIEDNCDALGSEYNGKKTGSFGDLSTCSFYPAHHMTMGEGGAVSIIKENLPLYRAVRSIRDWGRDCWCEGDEQSFKGACGKRLDWEIDGVKYDHRFIYSHIGYNLKPTEIQAAMGLEQIKRINDFNTKRRQNYKFLFDKLKKYDEYFLFPIPPKKSNPAWFTFPITIKNGASFTRADLTNYLEENNILTRLIFGGDITKQPAYQDIKMKNVGGLKNSGKIMRDSFFIGVHPGLYEPHLKYIVETFNNFFKKYK